jgi:hypothetical protein
VNIVDISSLLVGRAEHPDLVTHITHPDARKSVEERRKRAARAASCA